MLNKILNVLFMRVFRAKRAAKKFFNCLESELAEEFLELLLRLMNLVFFLNKKYRQNIKDFYGRYLFQSKDKSITIAAIFENSKMKVYEKEIDNTNVTIIFKDQHALMNFLLSPKPDILGAILNQDVTYNGNLNYLSKFAYMAKRLQLTVAGDR